MIRLLFSGNCCTLCAWQVFVPVRVYGITSCQSLCPFPMIPCEAHSSNPQYHVILLLHCHVSSSTHHFKTIQCYQISLVSFTGPYWNQPAPFLSWQNRNQRWNSTENHIGPNSCITCHCLNNMAIISLNKTVIIYKLLINTNLLTQKKKRKKRALSYMTYFSCPHSNTYVFWHLVSTVPQPLAWHGRRHSIWIPNLSSTHMTHRFFLVNFC